MINNGRLYAIIITSGILLLIPLIAMQFTTEVNWNVGDFAVAAALFLGVGLALEFVLRKVKSTNGRIAIALSILVLFCLLWVELAVGIFGSPLSGS